jgi:hypothetical protein
MCAYWFNIVNLYGYRFKYDNMNEFIYSNKYKEISELVKKVRQPFQIQSIILNYDSFINNLWDMENEETINKQAVIVIGFHPSDNLEETMKMANDLKEYVKLLTEKFDINPNPGFQSGAEWNLFEK